MPRSRTSKKIFYKIGEVCELTETEPYVLRYWESEFPFLAPEKNRAGQRIYSDEDIGTAVDQQSDHRRMILGRGPLKRGLPFPAVGRVDVGAGAEKVLHRLDPAGAGTGEQWWLS